MDDFSALAKVYCNPQARASLCGGAQGHIKVAEEKPNSRQNLVREGGLPGPQARRRGFNRQPGQWLLHSPGGARLGALSGKQATLDGNCDG